MADADSRDNMNGGNSAGDQENICRDFLRNVCRRGKRCKYQHPEPNDADDFGRKADYIFCHDYQNKECRRPNCKFVHCTRSEEEYFRSCGQLPPRSNGNRGNHGMGGANEMDSDIPICKDFQKGECRRGGRCKFRHIGIDFNMDMGRDQFGGMGGGGGYVNFEDFDYYEPERKRRMFGAGGGGGGGHDFGGGSGMNNRQSMPPAPPMPLSGDFYIMEEENAFLRRKVEELKKQVGDLTATNEFLLDQNAQLRLSKQANVTGVNPNSMASAATPVQSTMAQMSQQMPLKPPEMTSPSGMAQELAAATTQAIVPVSLTQAATLAPVSIAPLSITQAIPAVSLAQNPLVSYPIMTQNLRPALASTSLTH